MTNLDTIYATVKEWFDKSKVANPEFTPTYDVITGLLNKIGKQINIPQNFTNKLAFFKRGVNEFGRTIEEWQAGLATPEDYDIEGKTTLAPRFPKFLPAYYSYEQEDKPIAVTRNLQYIRNAALNAETFAQLVASMVKSMYDSGTLFDYGAYRGLVGAAISKAKGTGVTNYATNTAYKAGDYVKSGNDLYIILEAIASSNADPIATLVTNGKAVKLDLVEAVADPRDTEGGEKFVIALNIAVEKMKNPVLGRSLNGNTLGEVQENGAILLVKEGVMPYIDVNVLAGAFHRDNVAIPAEITILPDFGFEDDASDVIAVLADRRMFAAFENFRYTMEQPNAQGGNITYFLHHSDTLSYSPNTHFRVFTSTADLAVAPASLQERSGAMSVKTAKAVAPTQKQLETPKAK